MDYLAKVTRLKKNRLLSLKRSFKEEAVRLVKLLLTSGYKCKRIYFYGSGITNKPFNPWSDIDLAIEGLADTKFLKVYALFLRSSHFPIDLKPFEDLEEPIKNKIKKEGKVIYEER